ncbi:MAG: hypothetical protein R3335_09970 [Anaerolineales bacterium]|nr:hypothetical protein [Anaerolineales bacterium]
MKLTRRQEEFISNLIDLSDEVEGPIHYSLLADRLGVSPFTAYDMLCLLEEKGMVTSEYQLAEGKRGPGRAERLFYPCKTPQEREEELVNEFGGSVPDKEALKQLVLAGFESGEVKDKQLASAVLARVPDIDDHDISFGVELMTIAALRMQEYSGRQLWTDYLPEILGSGNPSSENLSLLGGFALGILAKENTPDSDWVRKLFVYIQQYLSIVHQLSAEQCDQLAEALAGVFIKEPETV